MAYRISSTWRRDMMLGCCLLLTACTTSSREQARLIRPGAGYVAMGSSFAAGPGVTTSADQPPTRCARSADNYAHLLARSLSLRLTDVSCSGAKTEHLLGPWNDLPPQLDALTRDTRLVTITIGGNDVGYIGTLGSVSCRSFSSPPLGTPGGKCPDAPRVSESEWTNLNDRLRRIVSEARHRAPAARLIFIDYVSVLPTTGTCAGVPLSVSQADASRATARRLAVLTARVAAETGAEMFYASNLSKDHSACSSEPWVRGFPLPGATGFVPYHPNEAGMAAIANALERHLRRR